MKNILILSILIISSAVFAGQKIDYVIKLDELDGRLSSVLEKSKISPQQKANADLVVDAKARIVASRSFLSDKPGSKQAPHMFSACSLLVEAASKQLAMFESDQKTRQLQKDINKTYVDLSETYEQILKIERSHASRLKKDLDTEKMKAQKLREEAERKFNELQSELISVKSDARGTIISMSDILFDIGKASLTSNLKTNLAKIAGILSVFKTSYIVVEGHTDNQGSEQYNQHLSEKRAENVMGFLTEQGIAPERMQSVGYGFSKPVADNSTKEGRQKNRRVDLIIQDEEQHRQSKQADSDW
ncbi:MAG: OmpA family protein [Chitinivibrionales bacterium]